MSRIPDCRTDEYYNEKYLCKEDKNIISGYDYATEVIKMLFDNLDVYINEFDIENEDINLVRFFENHPKIAQKAKEAAEDWLETDRNLLITVMLDNMPDEAYQSIKVKVDIKEAAEKEEGLFCHRKAEL